MIINHNMSAINAQRVLKFNHWDQDRQMNRLASGMRINKAGDDAAGLAVSEKMRTQIQGLRQAERNTEDGMSFIQTTEGYLDQTAAMIQRIRVLAVQSANGIYSEEDRKLIQVELSQLVDEVDRIASQAEFNKMPMLTGRFTKAQFSPKSSMWFQIGANQNQREQVFVRSMTAAAFKFAKAGSGPQGRQLLVSLETPGKSNETIKVMDDALQNLSKQRADLGAFYNRLEHSAKGLMNAYENIQASESRIRDADMAEELLGYTRAQILTQSGTAMLGQANLQSQSVLRLLSM